jgi:hypothetical protein
MFCRRACLSCFFLFSTLVGLVGCSAAEPEASTDDTAGLTSSREPGVDVNATYRFAFSGIPTIGSENPDVPLLTMKITVDDEAIRRQHPGFDGLERVFAMVPRRAGGQTTLERIELPFDHSELRGFIQLRYVDVHAIENLHLSKDDLAATLAEGIAVGLDTNVGTLWAQEPGHNFVPVPAS